ncbi:guanylate-binding protein 6-like, partial [Sigmodon hispidus]
MDAIIRSCGKGPDVSIEMGELGKTGQIWDCYVTVPALSHTETKFKNNQSPLMSSLKGSGLKMMAPICLVENHSEQLSVNQKAIKILDKISQPVVVVAIVGLYRTGKSYLMNCLAGQSHGFPLGSTVQSETKGIWMWCVPHPTKPKHTLVLLDTEGLGDVEKGDPKNDSWIFALAVLLSSSFVYNSMSTINHQALEQLHYVTELTELIRARSSPNCDGIQNSTEFVSFFPDFIWTVRDFMLELKLHGKDITEDEYLENALKLIPGNNPRIQASNLSRECIRHFFPERKCFVFDRPTNDKEFLRKLETITEDQLDPKFQEQTRTFVSYISTNAKTKTLREGIKVTGNRLGTLVTTYVDAINSGAVPCLDDAVTTLAQRENSAAVQRAVEHYSEQMAQRLKLPTDTLQELLDAHMACEQEAIAVFMEHSFKDENQQFQKKLLISIELIVLKRADFLLENEEASEKYCQKELNRLVKTLRESVSAGIFSIAGGHRLYMDMKAKIENDYWRVSRKGVKARGGPLGVAVVHCPGWSEFSFTKGKYSSSLVSCSEETTMMAPICLVENDKEQLFVNQKAIEILDKISQPVVVVAIVGLYRTGKSYLMNRLAGQNHGFPLGSTVQSETKGIWMWCVPHPSKPKHTLVLLDTEGLGDVEKGDPKNDSWIFALAVLLSSTFVYNSMGTINQQALEQLHYITELTELIRARSSPNPDGIKNSTEFVSFFPNFIWTVRDFMLELKLHGKDITEDEYLENALKLIQGNNPRIQASNLSRECIRHFFPERKCFVFDQPTNDKKLLLKLETITEDQLDPKFQEQTRTFVSYISTNAKPKILREGIKVTGDRLGTLVTTYVDAINSGAVPCLDDAVTTLAQRENSAAVQRAVEHYNEQMAQRLKLPTDMLQELLDAHMACEQEAIAVFMEHSFKDENQQFQKKLLELLDEKKRVFILKNEEASEKYCQEELNRLSKAITENISTFSVPGGHSHYMEMRKKIEHDFWQVPKKGVKASEVFQSFLQSQATIESSILQADTALTAGEKTIAEERAQKEAAEKEQELLRQKQKEQQQLMEAQEKSHKENLEQLRTKLVQEREQLIKDHETMLQKQLQNQKALLEEGFKKKAEEMSRETQKLKNAVEEMQRNSEKLGVIERSILCRPVPGHMAPDICLQ